MSTKIIFTFQNYFTLSLSYFSIRGRLGTIYQYSRNLGILFSYTLGSFFNYITASYFYSAIVVLFYATFVFLPSTPQYLLRNDKIEVKSNYLSLFIFSVASFPISNLHIFRVPKNHSGSIKDIKRAMTQNFI